MEARPLGIFSNIGSFETKLVPCCLQAGGSLLRRADQAIKGTAGPSKWAGMKDTDSAKSITLAINQSDALIRSDARQSLDKRGHVETGVKGGILDHQQATWVRYDMLAESTKSRQRPSW